MPQRIADVWADRYDRELADLFAVQDEITEAVTIAIAPAIADAERQRAMRKSPGASTPGPPTRAACGISAKAPRATTLSQRASFSKPSTSIRASRAATRGSLMPEREPLACMGGERRLKSRPRDWH